MSMEKKKTIAPRKGSNRARRFEMSCRSNPKEIGKVEEFLRKVNQSLRLDDGTFYRLLIATTEAVNNAIIHGNKLNPKKNVKINCICNTDTVKVFVKDSGGGFDSNAIPSPIDEENLLKESGRGIFLIRSMMDTVRFSVNKEGTTVEMIVDLSRLNPKRSIDKKGVA